MENEKGAVAYVHYSEIFDGSGGVDQNKINEIANEVLKYAGLELEVDK
ncbi:MAG: hypothetical protein IJ191_07510 [Treponema sp.]|nr:hypothetical protein [Treponema sp.]